MSDSEDSIVIYTEVSSPFEDLSDIGSSRVDGLPMMLEDPYVEAVLQAPPSPDYVPGPEHPPSPVYVPYVPEPAYPEAIRSEDQAVLEELERLKRQEKEANDAAEVLRKEFAQSTEDLLLQAGATRLPNPNDWLLVTPKTSHHNCCKKSLGNLTTRRLSISRAGDLCHGNARSRHHKLLLTIEAEYVAAANCYGQVLRIQNHIIVKHPMFTLLNKAVQNKAMRIRHHYIRDAYERRLIPSADDSHYDNVADLLTKAFDFLDHLPSSQTVNNEKQIHATVDSKAVVVTEASIRNSLLLHDADGTACLTNEAIFQNLALMGYSLEALLGVKLDRFTILGYPLLDEGPHPTELRTKEKSHQSSHTTAVKVCLVIYEEKFGKEWKSVSKKGENAKPKTNFGVPIDDHLILKMSVLELDRQPTTACISDDVKFHMAQTLIKKKEEKAQGKREWQ
ncbi:hypothetical protein Tco_0221061 [Tanacetum coccineum]